MTCHNCGGELEKVIVDLPFKVEHNSIIIIRQLPVLQCQNCSEFLIEDTVMKEIDKILKNVDKTAELEILNYV